MARHALILAGGSGVRLWPMSRRDTPKQLIPFIGGKSLLQLAWERAAGLVPPDHCWVCAGERHRDAVLAALPELGPVRFLGEPQGRDTLGAIGYSAAAIQAGDPEASMAVFPADHLVGKPGRFHEAIDFGIGCLARRPGLLITLGLVPDHPETGYGYIAPGEALEGAGGYELRRVLAFREKPDGEKAREYIAQGCLWNAGMFIWRVGAILEAFRKHLPVMYGQAMAMVSEGEITPGGVNAFYSAVEPVSIDYGIMEKASDAGVIPAEFGWDDIGSWDALGKALPSDDAGNTCRGEVVVEDSRGNVVWATGKKIALVGVNDLVVVEGEDAILVCPRNRSQDVGRLAKKMK